MTGKPVQRAAALKTIFKSCCTGMLGTVIMLSNVHAQQAAPPMDGMDHSNMNHGSMNHSGMPEMKGGSNGAVPGQTAPAAPIPRPAPGFEPHAHPPEYNPNALAPRYSPENDPREYQEGAMGGEMLPGMDMAMADNDVFSLVRFDQLEYTRSSDDSGIAWDVDAWIGKDYNKFWFKTEGERVEGESGGRVEALWSHAVAAFWDVQTGLRHDFGQGPSRQWLALGFQGIAPYWFDIEAFAYLGPAGRTAARAKAEYNLRITQRAFLSPEIEVSAYGKSDRERGIGSGLSEIEAGLRFRYEIRREVAPYIGVTWGRKLGETADFAREAGESRTERQVVAGVRIWF